MSSLSNTTAVKVRRCIRQHPGFTTREVWLALEDHVEPQLVSNALQRMRRRNEVRSEPAEKGTHRAHRFRWFPV